MTHHDRASTTAGRFALTAAWHCLVVFAWCVRLTASPFRMRVKNTFIVLHPAGLGSLGDEAIVSGLLRENHEKGKTCLRWLNTDDSVSIPGSTPPLRSLGKSPWCFALVIADALKAEETYLLGADVLDGYYSPIGSWKKLAFAALAHTAGSHVNIVSFSLNEMPHPACADAFRSLPRGVRIVPRDPRSRERCMRMLSRDVPAGADCAFLLEPKLVSATAESTAAWMEGKKKSGPIVGVSVHAKPPEWNDHVSTLARASTLFLERNMTASLVFIPHDERGKPSDGDTIQAVVDLLPAALSGRHATLRFPLHASDVRFLAGKLDVAFCERMHVTIACLGSGTPVLCCPYQGKFEGLLDHFGMSGQIIHPDVLKDPELLCSAWETLLADAPDLRRVIAEAWPRVLSLARANIPSAT